MKPLSEEEPLRPGSTVRRIVNGKVVALQVVQDQGGKLFVTDPANPKRVDQINRDEIAPLTPEEEEAEGEDLNPNGSAKLKPHGIVPTQEGRPFRMDRPRPFQLTNPTSTPRTAHCTCQTCGDGKPDDGAMHCEKCRNGGKRQPSQHESRLVAVLEDIGNSNGEDAEGYATYPKGKTLVGAFGYPEGTVVDLTSANAYNPDFMMCRWPDGQVMELESHEYMPI